jgi:hypothetical protein
MSLQAPSKVGACLKKIRIWSKSGNLLEALPHALPVDRGFMRLKMDLGNF